MNIKELPLKFMQVETSSPRQELLDRIVELQVHKYLQKKYESLEDRADAFDGAFTATQIELHLQGGSSREDMYIEILGWYQDHHKDIEKSPFYEGLRTTLSAMELDDFYEEAIDFIIDCHGQF